ncbi:MAG: sugar transporter substrate-binding protein, partial [Microvirga sp.]|nr:sugar transporter substrate-binding protein [Microvirga sp.]
MKLTRRILMGAAAGSLLLSSGAAMAQQTELTFWSWRQEDKAFYQDTIKKFQEKNPGITVKFETYAPENYQTILSTALAAGRGPDVIQVRAYGNLETIATPGYLLALDQQNVPELANFPEASLAAETLRSDGKVYAVPFAM